MQSKHRNAVYPLPIVPYAVPFSMAVSYQHLRQSQLKHQQEDAQNEFRACIEILQGLQPTWCSVDTIVALAKKVFGEIDRTSDLDSLRIPRDAQKRDYNAVPRTNFFDAADTLPATCADGARPPKQTHIDTAAAGVINGTPAEQHSDLA